MKKKFTPTKDENGVWLVPTAFEEWDGDEFKDAQGRAK